MTRGRRKKRLSLRSQIFALGLVLLMASYAVLAAAEKLSPEEGLVKIVAEEKINDDYTSTLRDPIIAIKKNPLTEIWGAVVLARKLDVADEKKLALELLESTLKTERKNSAALVEANLLITRLKLELDKDLADGGAEGLSKQLELYRRRDLEPESLYADGLLQIKQGKLEQAKKTLIGLRERFPTSPFSKAAREHKEFVDTPPDLKEVELLIKENETKKAASLLEAYQDLQEENSEKFFEGLLTQDILLRKQKEPLKADELLLLIATDAPEGPASNALFRAAKNAWNENNTLRALELLDQIFKRFPKSALIPDARYTEARILEELGKLREAEKIYESPIAQLDKTAGDKKECLKLVKSIKRAVWLKFARGDYENAAKLAEKALVTVSPIATDPELRLEEAGLKYWQARSIRETKSPTAQAAALKLFTEIFEADRRSFYGSLSKEILENNSGSTLSFFPPANNKCTGPEFQDLSKQLSIFSHPKLRVYAQREIDFTFGELRANAASPELIPLIAAQSKVSSLIGLASAEIELAEEGLRLGKQNPGQFYCDRVLAELAYPLPYIDQYKKAESINQVPISLSLGISRSESLFNPEAVSVVGALGLMQLMVDTAKLEGWPGKPELTDADTNITFGVKHLKRLLNSFNGDTYKVAASYNAGSSAVNRWTDRYGIFPSELFVEFIGYPETNKYVRRVYAAKKVYEELLKSK